MKINKKKIFITTYLLILISANAFGYWAGRESYLEVGFNSASIDARYIFLEKLSIKIDGTENNNIPSCNIFLLNE